MNTSFSCGRWLWVDAYDYMIRDKVAGWLTISMPCNLQHEYNVNIRKNCFRFLSLQLHNGVMSCFQKQIATKYRPYSCVFRKPLCLCLFEKVFCRRRCLFRFECSILRCCFIQTYSGLCLAAFSLSLNRWRGVGKSSEIHLLITLPLGAVWCGTLDANAFQCSGSGGEYFFWNCAHTWGAYASVYNVAEKNLVPAFGTKLKLLKPSLQMLAR